MSGTKSNRGAEWDWQNDASAENMREAIEKLFKKSQLSGLCYDLRGLNEALTDEDILAAAALIFDYPGSNHATYAILPHESIGGGRALCITNPLKNNGLLKMVIHGQDCHLFYVDRVFGPLMSSKTSFSFATQWGRARFLPGTRVCVRDGWQLSVSGTREGFEERSSVFGWGKAAVLIVKETYFINSRNQALAIAGLMLDHPELAELMSSLADAAEDHIAVGATDLEVAEVCVSDGGVRHHVRICAHMLEEVLDDDR